MGKLTEAQAKALGWFIKHEKGVRFPGLSHTRPDVIRRLKDKEYIKWNRKRLEYHVTDEGRRALAEYEAG